MDKILKMKPIKQAVILAGGLGTRLRPLTLHTPKPMVLVNHRPFLEYLIEMLKDQGITDVLLLLGYLPEKVTNHFGVNMQYSITPIEDESATRLKKADNFLDNIFILMYCDNYWPLNLQKLSDFYFSKKKQAAVTVYTNKDNVTKNNILVDENGLVFKYDKTRTDTNLNGVEIGFFILNKSVLNLIPKDNTCFSQIIPKLVEQQQLSGFTTDHRYYSISTLEKLKITEKFLAPKKIIFLDRDGVINKKASKADYIKTWGEFEFLPGAIQALQLLKKNNYQIFLISNQAGIARQIMNENNFWDIHQKMQAELKKRQANVDGIYYCPHGWNDGCDCRKPKAGMFFQVAREHHLDLTKIVFIGDDERDMQAGDAAGCKTILITPNKNLLQIVNSLLN